MSSLRRLMDSIAEAGREILASRGLAGAPRRGELTELCEALISNKAEVVGLALAKRLTAGYHAMNPGERLAFFRDLRDGFSPDTDGLLAAIDAYWLDHSPENALALHEAAESPRQALIRAMNAAPDAMATVVQMREDLLDFLREDESLRVVDRDFEHVLASWFNKGFLELRRIDWDSPASVLEQLIRYEAVHDIQGWDDLRRRLAGDRRCYGFFHPALEDQILIFIEVALTREISADVHEIIHSKVDPDGAREATTAIFYSINNCQNGLRGISFGNFLIKRVVAQIQNELPRLKTFSTLSPIPGFSRWLGSDGTELPKIEGAESTVASIVTDDWTPEKASESERTALTRLCAHYLANVKAGDGKPKDPVARFHLGNGARLERINWRGDRSRRGVKQSYGLLVNYLYDLGDLEQNHEAFHEQGKIFCGRSVRALLG